MTDFDELIRRAAGVPPEREDAPAGDAPADEEHVSLDGGVRRPPQPSAPTFSSMIQAEFEDRRASGPGVMARAWQLDQEFGE